MSKFLILIVAFLIFTGLFRPMVRKLNLGRLPGDIHVEYGNMRLYLPITTSILVSLALGLLIWLLRH